MKAFHHIGLSCKDQAATERFYSDHFGFKRARVVPLGETQIVFLKAGDVYLELFEADEERPVPAAEADGPHYAGVRHIAFMVDDVDATLAAMGGAADVTLGPLDFGDFIPGWKTAWVKDPDGSIVEITQGYQDEPNPPPFT